MTDKPKHVFIIPPLLNQGVDHRKGPMNETNLLAIAFFFYSKSDAVYLCL